MPRWAAANFAAMPGRPGEDCDFDAIPLKKSPKRVFLEKARFAKCTPERVSSVTKNVTCYAVAPVLVHRP